MLYVGLGPHQPTDTERDARGWKSHTGGRDQRARQGQGSRASDPTAGSFDGNQTCHYENKWKRMRNLASTNTRSRWGGKPHLRQTFVAAAATAVATWPRSSPCMPLPKAFPRRVGLKRKRTRTSAWPNKICRLGCFPAESSAVQCVHCVI